MRRVGLLICLLGIGLLGGAPPDVAQATNATQSARHYYLPVIFHNDLRNSPKKGLVYYPYYAPVEPRFSISWYLNYILEPSPQLAPQRLQFIPFLWCAYPPGGDHNTDMLAQAVAALGRNYDGYLLFLNEPELGGVYGQCALTDVNAAADFYIRTRQQLPQARLVGPHSAYDDNIKGHTFTWLHDWREAVRSKTCAHPEYGLPCGYPQNVAYGAHLFGESAANNLRLVDELHAQLIQWGEGYKQVWVTEFTFCYDVVGHDQELETTVMGFEVLPYVGRYAFYTNRIGPNDWTPPPSSRCFQKSFLLDPLTNWRALTPLGEIYRLLP